MSGPIAPRPDAPDRAVITARPPALAQIRFAQRRAEFGSLDLAARFQRIYETNLWGAETSTSGVGSEHAATQAVRRALPPLLLELGVRSLLDAPCGDGSWMRGLDLGPIAYAGIDIIAALISTLSATSADCDRRFLVADLTHDPLPRCDLILCRDCLVHLSFTNIFKALANFRRSGSSWLLTTTFTELSANADIEDGDWRPLNFAKGPFRWPEPERLIDEQCDEMNGAYRDKSLGLWRLSAIPSRFSSP